MARIAPSLAPVIKLPVMSAVPAKESVETPMPMGVADQIARHAHVAEIAAPADHDVVAWSGLDDIAAHHAVGLHRDADTSRVGVLAEECADEVALHDCEPAALAEIGDRDAHRSVIDDVVGDHRGLEGELGIERDVAEPRAGLPIIWQFEPEVERIAEKAQSVMRLLLINNRARVKRIDTIAVLPAAAALCGDALDAVRDDDGAVLADLRAPDEDAVVAAVMHMVMRDLESGCVLADSPPSRMSPISQSVMRPETLRNTTPSSALPMMWQSDTVRPLTLSATSSAPPSIGFASPSSVSPVKRMSAAFSMLISAPPPL
jgi:hypothetical protein